MKVPLGLVWAARDVPMTETVTPERGPLASMTFPVMVCCANKDVALNKVHNASPALFL
ncbi:hypothetical protein D3C81_2133920 [compost metagenome]